MNDIVTQENFNNLPEDKKKEALQAAKDFKEESDRLRIIYYKTLP